jgi:hypothetical protein
MRIIRQIIGAITIAMLSACAMAPSAQNNATAVYEAFTRQYEIAFGKPRSEWTLEERAVYLEALQKFQQQRLAQIDAQSRHPINFPVIQPPDFQTPQYQPRQSTIVQIKPDGNGGYTAWGNNGTTRSVKPDGRGGYTIWGSDGSTHQLVPDGHGGWTQW